jgi:hypothetical protein
MFVTRSHALRTGARALLIGARAHIPMKNLQMQPRALAVRNIGVRCFSMQAAGSSSGGGRTSAAVTQDADKRSSARKASSNDKLDLVSFTALQHHQLMLIASNLQVPARTTTHTCVQFQLVLTASSCVYAFKQQTCIRIQ